METMNEFVQAFNRFLTSSLDCLPDSRVREAMYYALVGEGKRFRPLLVYASTGKDSYDFNLLTCASALEMIHTYSLIHDDMPCMDDDDYRRGRLTLHKQFDEATALLAGDGLLTYAFEMLIQSDLNDYQKVQTIKWLSRAAGASGMVLGQDIDLINEHNNQLSDAKLEELYRLKTGALFGCALVFGQIINQNYEQLQDYYEIGLKLGFLFQIQDDYLETISDFKTLGKSVMSDVKQQKSTYVSRYSLDYTKLKLDEGFSELKRDIINLRLNSQSMITLIEQVQNRNH